MTIKDANISKPGRSGIDDRAGCLPPGMTERLAEFAVDTRWESLPDAVIEKVLLHIMDTIGCAAAASSLPWTKQVRAYDSRTGRDGGATVIGGSQLAAEWAAFVNATSAHGFELDDYCAAALAHPGCVVVPTVLAVGEELHSFGRDQLLACALGFETVVRLGLALGSSMVVDRGFHETCVEGVFGATVASVAKFFPNIDPATLQLSLDTSIYGVPESPILRQRGYELNEAMLNVGGAGGNKYKIPSFEKIVDNRFAGKRPRNSQLME